MAKKSITLSSAGLKNILINDIDKENEFRFIYGKEDIKMNKFVAEFLSPTVSQLLYSDPTFSSYTIDLPSQDIQNIFTEDIISLLKQLSMGFPIEFDSKQSLKLEQISIILGNAEMFKKIHDSFNPDLSKTNINEIIERILIYDKIPSTFQVLDELNLIDILSTRFYSINPDLLKKLPLHILYQIISNKNLRLENEDNLFDFIQMIFKDKYNDEDKQNIIKFYEKIEYSSLSESKFLEFINNFDSTEMTQILWYKLIKCFYINHKSVHQIDNDRYSIGTVKQCPNGIFQYFFDEFHSNPVDCGLIEITGNSYDENREKFLPNIVDPSWNSNHWASKDVENSYVKIEFKKSFINFNKYRLKSGFTNGNCFFTSWTLKGITKYNQEVILDEVDDTKELSIEKPEITKTIDNELPLRSIQLTMKGTRFGETDHHMDLRNIELFGSIISFD